MHVDLKVYDFESILNSTSSKFDCKVNSTQLLHNARFYIRLQNLRLHFVNKQCIKFKFAVLQVS